MNVNKETIETTLREVFTSNEDFIVDVRDIPRKEIFITIVEIPHTFEPHGLSVYIVPEREDIYREILDRYDEYVVAQPDDEMDDDLQFRFKAIGKTILPYHIPSDKVKPVYFPLV